MPGAVHRQAVVRHPAFLVTECGQPFTAADFGNKFRAWRDEVGLPRRVAAEWEDSPEKAGNIKGRK